MGGMIGFKRPEGSTCEGYPAKINVPIRYDATHAFAKEDGQAYAAAAAKKAWERTMAFLGKHL
jgi:dienelactone hydrolase